MKQSAPQHNQQPEQKVRPHEASTNETAFDLPAAAVFAVGLERMPGHSTARPLRQAAVMQMQQTQGNRYVQRKLHSQGQVRPSILVIQRQDKVDESHEEAVKALDLAGYPESMAPNAAKLASGAAKLVTVGQQLAKQGKGVFFDDKAILNSAQSIIDTAKAITELGTGVTAMCKEGSRLKSASEGLSKGADMTAHASRVVSAINLAASIADDSKLNDFLAKPDDPKKASEWAKHVGDTFTKASKLVDGIPDGLLPGFVVSYYKGLLSAPANYIAAFQAIMQARYDRIDAETGGSSADQKAVEGEKVVWEGPLSGLFIGATFVQPSGLQGFMLNNRTIGGMDLYQTPYSVGKSLLASAVQGSGQLTDDQRSGWLNYLNSR